jgi:RNA polymerase sigma-70 factor (ECF subfamily)
MMKSPDHQAPILYVEDEEDYQTLVRRILGKAGLMVDVVDTAEEGLAILQRQRPRLLMLDINLPGMDGYSVCRKLHDDPAFADLPILMLTVRRRPEEWLRGFSSGANDYISKPLNPPELIERVVNCLEGKTGQIPGEGTAEYNLIRAAVAGNRSAFEVLIQKYKTRLIESLSGAGPLDSRAEDAVANAFGLAFERLGEFRGEASFYTWLYRIALNEFTRPNRRPSPISLDVFANGDESSLLKSIEPSESLESEIADRQIGQKAQEALGSVPEPYRKVLELYFLQDLSYQAIARKLRIPEGTVMSRLFKARKLLQESWHSKEAALKA